jgi:hypothetical protein
MLVDMIVYTYLLRNMKLHISFVWI